MILNKSNFVIVLPAYNEAITLPTVLHKLKTHFSCNQIFLADDGSTDGTSEIARKLGVRVIRNPHNKGKGYILRSTFSVIIQQFPKAKWILTMDTDGQHCQKDIPKFFDMVKLNPDVGIIIGRRNYRQMPSFNSASNTLTTRWCNYWLKWRLSDLQCGFRCYSIRAIQKVMNYGLSRNRFDFETEVLLVAWYLDLKINDIPITTLYPTNRRKSRVIPLIDTFRWILLMFQFGFSLKFLHKIWKMK